MIIGSFLFWVSIYVNALMQKEKIIRIEFQTTIAIQNIFPCKIIFLFKYNIKITDKK